MTSLPPAAPGRPPSLPATRLIGPPRGFLTACLPYSGKVHSRGNSTAPAASSLSKVGSEGTSCSSYVAVVVRMKSGGPWNLRGLRPEAREAVRTAARRSGVSVGEWLNDVIEPDDEDDDEPTLFSDYDDEDDDERPRRSRSRRDEREPRQRGNDRQARLRGDERGARHRGDDRELRQRDDDQEPPEPQEPRRDRDEERRQDRVSDFERESARTRGALNQVHSRLDKLSQQLERLARSEAAARQLAPQRRAASLGGGHNDANGRLTGAPAQPRRPTERPAAPPAAPRRPIERPAVPPPAPVRNRPAANADSMSIDDAVAEIAARQRALDGDPAPQPATRDATAETARQRVVDSEPAPQPATRDAAAEIAARQRALDGDPAPQPVTREVP